MTMNTKALKKLMIVATCKLLLAAGGSLVAASDSYAANESAQNFESNYAQGQAQLDRGSWQQAQRLFEEAIEAGDQRADASHYWLAYALYKQREYSESLEQINLLLADYENSEWADDAQVLKSEIRQRLSHTQSTNWAERQRGAEQARAIAERNARKGAERGRIIAERNARAGAQRGREIARRHAERNAERNAHRNSQSSNHSHVISSSHNSDPEEEMKMIALESLIHADEERAFPIVKRVLEGNNSAALKQRALFMLSQFDNADAQDLLFDLAQKSDAGELRSQAIQMLGYSDSARVKPLLKRMYLDSSSYPERRQILQSFMVSDDSDTLFELLIADSRNTDKDRQKSLQQEGIRLLGAMGAVDRLKQIYDNAAFAAQKQTIIQSIGISGDVDVLGNMLKSENDPETIRSIIQSLGIAGDDSGELLVSTYQRVSDFETRSHVLNALSISGDVDALLAIIKSEPDPELKKRAVRALSLTGSDEALEYFQQLLDEES